ncbi:MAG: type III-B CRISPR module-associated protein Cmr5 [Desulfotignum sp.]|nr:type III-B CRISPR module-associated protein Cmr5 [Desulfotignum sp.]
MSTNMDQKRAVFALGLVNELTDIGQVKDLKTQSSKFIALIVNSGFLQAMDFFCNKNLERTYLYVQKWFAKHGEEGPVLSDEIQKAAAGKKLNQALASLSDRNEYRRAMQEAVAFLSWLKSKAEGRANEIEANKEHPTDQ